MKYLILFLLQMTFGVSAFAADPCTGCDKLKNIESQLRAKNKSEDYYNSLQLKATKIISSMSKDKDQLLTSAQVARVAQVIRLSVAVDKTEAIIDSNLQTLAPNELELKKEFAKFPKPEAEKLNSALDMAIGHIEKGVDPNAPPAL